ncbi:sulfotransferase [Sulfuricurvum sp.]|uniref:sulfotransferase n=1 Tax=Sulfuricurvum sp. TaxID=2025608 RepID=UPI002627351A|nr:sulfotransferase [Sulfuricurvum sp.]MDD2780469.1 sulfotransferase [Sulfuricurvum sp.]
MNNIQIEARRSEFKRNDSLESLLTEVNHLMNIAEKTLLDDQTTAYPIVFIVGPHRSGSTLITQWLANSGLVAYPTNLMSRFYKAPIIGAKIQLLLTDERYNYRNEIRDFNSSIDFYSENGKTKGALAPNEFWYFWRRFLPFEEIDYLSDDELFEKVDIKTLLAEFAGLTDVFQKPFALKAMILNYNIPFLNKIFDKAIFIYTKRDPLTNIESALKAREKQYGTINQWYSFKIPEYNQLKDMNPYAQVAGQIFYINKAVEKGLQNVPEHKKLVVEYEEFCENPKKFYDQIVGMLKSYGCVIERAYEGDEKFNVTRKSVQDENILKSYNFFSKMDN